MRNIFKFNVIPNLPERLGKLLEIANNLWWCWNPEAIDLFFRMDRDLWVECGQNPRLLLGKIKQKKLDELAKNDSFLTHMDRVYSRLQDYMKTNTYFERNLHAPKEMRILYMSAEFGVHESINIYSGGLGVLAGDHLKAASDLGLPLVGLGMLYREGYFRQYLNADGWQQELYPPNDFYNMPIGKVMKEDGTPLVIQVEYPGRMVNAYIWKCQVGRVPLYLLDTDHEDNSPADRSITGQLYGGDRETRIKQEIMLGMGGVIAAHTLKIRPTIFHLNEGHAAFMVLQRIKELVLNEGLTFNHAVETVKAGSYFTTHTPVPAGNDMFDPGLIERYFGKYCQDVGITLQDFLALGRQDPNDMREPFCMTVLALKLCAGANGVSKLHGEVSREMWSRVWKDLPVHEIPIKSITNGVHIRSWISRDLADLYDRYLGPGWLNSPEDHSIWDHVDEIPDTELWRTHERRRERLVDFARRRLVKQLINRGVPPSGVHAASECLDPECLTIGFARRFATYKRVTLLFRDPARLKRILLNPQMPVQLIIAGKAHPQDIQGKELIRQIIHFALDPDVRNHVVFLEDYDINLARYMVQGVDCWLNTPRRPMEASGTSGMKAAANGALNISIPDGWWCEAKELGPNGWTIGKGETYESTEEQDSVESSALYEILEQEIVPMFYNRSSDDLPREWIRRMKIAIKTICPVFNTYRMVQEYAEKAYIPLSVRRIAFRKDNRKSAYELSAWKQKIRSVWNNVRFVRVESETHGDVPVGTEIPIEADVYLDSLNEKDVIVEAYVGHLGMNGDIHEGHAVNMVFEKKLENNVYRFKGFIPCQETGLAGYSVRVFPYHIDLANKFEVGLITWA
ncbi:MAG TPA: alpha-glucan family phosphorylase [Candidatus Hydrogenedens sp.]|nr:alpha-glucan family phosphorylase [Candidatus Hydrogenedens sp.]HOL19838.1 alpha-glucan family phosphorylase [Candidatus Hydrogenedens sp.]